MASTYLTNTFGTPTNQNIFTLSFWLKRGVAGTDESLFTTDIVTGSVYAQILLNANGTLRWYGTDDAGGNILNLITNKVFPDSAGWFNLCFQFDNTQVTASDRQKIYVNGVKETSFSTEDYTNSSALYTWNEASRLHFFGAKRHTGTLGGYYNGLMSHVYFVDGSIIAPTEFGSTDATSGEWKINTSPTISSYGNNGFLIMKDSNTITDQSTNSNDWALGGGTLTSTEDSPTDNFCTFNALDNYYQQGTYSNGNTTFQTNTTNYTYNAGTIGVSKGKFYWEIKYAAKSGGNVEGIIGITSTQPTTTTKALGTYPNDWGYHTQNVTSYYLNNDVYTAYGTAYTEGDIIGVALDADNNKLYFSKNGTWQNSGDPTSGATGTGALSITAPGSTPLGAYFPAVCFYAGSNTGTFNTNFGNGIFGTTSITDEGTNAAGIGKFEYDVPTGYTALSAKGLNN